MKLSQGYAWKLPGLLTFMLFSLLAMNGCRTVNVVEHPDAEGRWTYRVVITKPNTENEGKRGYLLYRGKELTGHFSTIVIGETKYDYTFSINPGDFGGYARDPGYTPPTSTSPLQLTAGEQDRGWYFASADQRRQGTPIDWIWVKRENLEAFVDPDRLYKFINKYGLIPDADRQEPPFQFRLTFESKL
jgi:hypothetical protein